MINPRRQRYFKQAIVFGLIYFVSAIVYAVIEFGLLGDLTYYPTTGNVYSFKTSLLSTGIGSFLIGFVQGWIEVTWLRKRFEKNALWVKILAKSTFYLLFAIVFLSVLVLISNAIILGLPVWDPEVIGSLSGFASKFAYWSVVFYISVVLIVALVFAEIGEYFGMNLLYDFLMGKYHHPNQEVRIFMFLDMKSSTTIAENLGHKTYFELIKKYYSDMTLPILETAGEIYQYVGDEIVVSWLEKKGLQNNNCTECFRKISEAIERQKDEYIHGFGLVPEFKAGMHIGEVTSGEIGIIKKDIIYTGDVLNTTARIQGECNRLDTQLLVSDILYNQLQSQSGLDAKEIGHLQLRGKMKSVKLYSLSV